MRMEPRCLSQCSRAVPPLCGIPLHSRLHGGLSHAGDHIRSSGIAFWAEAAGRCSCSNLAAGSPSSSVLGGLCSVGTCGDPAQGTHGDTGTASTGTARWDWGRCSARIHRASPLVLCLSRCCSKPGVAPDRGAHPRGQEVWGHPSGHLRGEGRECGAAGGNCKCTAPCSLAWAGLSICLSVCLL